MRLEMKTKCYMVLSWMLMQAMWISVQNYKQICINYPKSVYTRAVSMLKKKRVC